MRGGQETQTERFRRRGSQSMSSFQKETLTSAVDPGNSQGVFLPVPSLIQLPNISSSEREETEEEEGGRGQGQSQSSAAVAAAAAAAAPSPL